MDCSSDMMDNEDITDILTDDITLNVMDYVLVKFVTSLKIIHYVGQIINLDSQFDLEINFLRKFINSFVFPTIADISLVKRSDIVYVLPKLLDQAGTSRTKRTIIFEIDLSNYNLR